jgi:hypothetical protein
MRILISIDDTDDLESRGTGELASMIADDLETNGWGKSSYVTRHQLLIHPDIPYTSHNSAMCFAAEIGEGALEKVIAHASAFLARESAAGSDPGLCVVDIDRLASPNELVMFGRKAKTEVVTKEQAYEFARRGGVHLSEHGGTGQGVIGALAGAGLRLGGNDGRLKGSLKIHGYNGMALVRDILCHPDVDEVRSIKGDEVRTSDLVRLCEKPKTVLLGGMAVLLVAAAGADGGAAAWQTLSRQQLRRF